MYQPRLEDFPNEAVDTDKLAQTLVVSNRYMKCIYNIYIYILYMYV